MRHEAAGRYLLALRLRESWNSGRGAGTHLRLYPKTLMKTMGKRQQLWGGKDLVQGVEDLGALAELGQLCEPG